MPTNKLWIEHTERAAWDSVEALRERLLKAETQLQALAPNVDRLPQLLDVLEQAKHRYAASLEGYDQIVAELLTRLDQQQAQLEAVETPEPTIVTFGAAPSRDRLDSEDLDDAQASDRFDDEAELDNFTRSMRRRRDSSSGDLPRDLNRLLALTEAKLDDLAELEGATLREAAVDLAMLAARIHEASRGRG